MSIFLRPLYLSENSPYLIAEVISTEEYLKDIALDNMPTALETVFIFDEWAGVLASHSLQGSDILEENELIDDALSFSLGSTNGIFSGDKTGEAYNVFIPTNYPDGWFIGVHIKDATQGRTQVNLFLPVYLVMFSMVLLLGIIIFLDVINDQEHAKKTLLPSTVDQLTGLLNVKGMYQATKEFAQNHRMDKYYFVCMDIVNFSRINTMFGYAFGDSLLSCIAHVISQDEHCCTRINADSFAFLTEYSEEKIESIKKMIDDSITLHLGQEYLQMIDFKFGLSPIEEDVPDFAKIYDGARLALTVAKKQVGVATVIYDAELTKELDLQKNIEINMIHALSNGEFEFYIQPQFTLPEETCSRGESLVRWDSETMGFLPPDKFISIFENNGFIVEIDFFMLKSALSFLQRRQNEGKPLIVIAVNQYKATVSFPNYYQRLRETILSYSVPLEYIELEITESTLDADLEMIVRLLDNVKELGL